ncbi:MAG: hypothetical protein J5517_02240 [Eubacterium sp.]|nr:hypothetical protein [Eubacterium sp.]
MKEFMSALGELQPATLVLLIFAAVLLLLLIILIIVTIRVLKSGSDSDDDREESEVKDKSENKDSDEDEEEEEDETTKKINEAVKSVEETKARIEAEKIAKEAEAARKARDEEERAGIKARVEEIAESVKKDSSGEEEVKPAPAPKPAEEPEDDEDDEEYDEEYEDGDEEFDDTEITGKLDTVKIEEELRKAGYMDKVDGTEDAENLKAKSEEYEPELDSAFVDKPEVPEGKTLDATEEAVVSEAVKATRQKEPKEKKKKRREPVIEKPAFVGVKSYWYNKQDVEGLARKEDIYFKSHYFEDPDDPILDLITEMYDCGYVRTEQLQRIAYGITFKSLGMKEILQSEEKIGFSKEAATKEPTESDKEEIYKKWCEYVDSFKDIIVIESTNEIEDYIYKKMYAYGHKDVEDLMNSPY